jgi:hypothetical protein
MSARFQLPLIDQNANQMEEHLSFNTFGWDNLSEAVINHK